MWEWARVSAPKEVGGGGRERCMEEASITWLAAAGERRGQSGVFFFFESSLYTAADWRQGAVSLVLRIQKMFMVTTGAD
jgi:hypothetical protein